MLRGVFVYRRFVRDMVTREFRGRYRGSLLGGAWALIQPLVLILVYTLVFSRVMRARLPGLDDGLAYSLYLCAGIFLWDYFARTLARCTTCFLDQAALLKKVAFPRSTLPAIAMVSATDGWSVGGEGTIVGNTIQAKPSPSGANVRFLGGKHPWTGGMFSITGNFMSNQMTNIHLVHHFPERVAQEDPDHPFLASGLIILTNPFDGADERIAVSTEGVGITEGPRRAQQSVPVGIGFDDSKYTRPRRDRPDALQIG